MFTFALAVYLIFLAAYSFIVFSLYYHTYTYRLPGEGVGISLQIFIAAMIALGILSVIAFVQAPWNALIIGGSNVIPFAPFP